MSEPQDLPLRGPPAVSSQCSSNSLVPLYKYPARSCQPSDQNPASVWVRPKIYTSPILAGPKIYTSPTLAGPSITSLTLSVWLSLNLPSTLTPHCQACAHPSGAFARSPESSFPPLLKCQLLREKAFRDYSLGRCSLPFVPHSSPCFIFLQLTYWLLYLSF